MKWHENLPEVPLSLALPFNPGLLKAVVLGCYFPMSRVIVSCYEAMLGWVSIFYFFIFYKMLPSCVDDYQVFFECLHGHYSHLKMYVPAPKLSIDSLGGVMGNTHLHVHAHRSICVGYESGTKILLKVPPFFFLYHSFDNILPGTFKIKV